MKIPKNVRMIRRAEGLSSRTRKSPRKLGVFDTQATRDGEDRIGQPWLRHNCPKEAADPPRQEKKRHVKTGKRQ